MVEGPGQVRGEVTLRLVVDRSDGGRRGGEGEVTDADRGGIIFDDDGEVLPGVGL